MKVVNAENISVVVEVYNITVLYSTVCFRVVAMDSDTIVETKLGKNDRAHLPCHVKFDFNINS